MEIYSVAFFGHREVENHIYIEEKLLPIIERLIKEREYVEFLVGNDGEFDAIVASSVRKAKKLYRNDNSTLIWVMPYLKSQYLKNEKSIMIIMMKYKYVRNQATCFIKKLSK